jgi:hypothetical protein
LCSERVEEEEKINGCIYCIAVVGKAIAGSCDIYNIYIYIFVEKKETAELTIMFYTYSEKRYS